MGRSPAPLRPRVLVDRLVDLAPRLSLADRRVKASVLDQLETASSSGRRTYCAATTKRSATCRPTPTTRRCSCAWIALWPGGVPGSAGSLVTLARVSPTPVWQARRFATHSASPWVVGWRRVSRRAGPDRVGRPEEGERLEETLSLLVTRIEGEAFTEGGPGWRRWLRSAAGGRRLTELQLLIEIFERAPRGRTNAGLAVREPRAHPRVAPVAHRPVPHARVGSGGRLRSPVR